MKLYFALSYAQKTELSFLIALGARNILLSYYVLSSVPQGKIDFSRYTNTSFFLDSGAFTVFTKNITINIDKYIEFIRKTKGVWQVVAGLDVIGDPLKTKENLEKMEEAGIKVLPTFHLNSPLEELHNLCKEHTYIALGGLVPIAMHRNKMRNWLDKCFAIIKQYPNLKTHGFGINSIWAMKRYPFYSVDATSWSSVSRYGRGYMQFKSGNIKEMKAYKRLPWKYRLIKTAQAYMEAEKFITDLWNYRGYKYE